MELSSEVEDVIFGKTCRRKAIKATQGFDLGLLEYGRIWSRDEVKPDEVGAGFASSADVKYISKKTRRVMEIEYCQGVPGAEPRRLPRRRRAERLRSSVAMARASGLLQSWAAHWAMWVNRFRL